MAGLLFPTEPLGLPDPAVRPASSGGHDATTELVAIRREQRRLRRPNGLKRTLPRLLSGARPPVHHPPHVPVLNLMHEHGCTVDPLDAVGRWAGGRCATHDPQGIALC